MLSTFVAPANAQLQTLYHAAHGPHTGTTAQDSTFPFLGDIQGGQDGRPAEEVVGLLARELENLILETQLRADGGPLKSAAFFIGAYCKDYNGAFVYFALSKGGDGAGGVFGVIYKA